MKGFSTKRALGVSSAKSKISKSTGVPLTKAGRKRKVQRTATEGCFGCMLPVIMLVILIVPAIAYALTKW